MGPWLPAPACQEVADAADALQEVTSPTQQTFAADRQEVTTITGQEGIPSTCQEIPNSGVQDTAAISSQAVPCHAGQTVPVPSAKPKAPSHTQHSSSIQPTSITASIQLPSITASTQPPSNFIASQPTTITASTQSPSRIASAISTQSPSRIASAISTQSPSRIASTISTKPPSTSTISTKPLPSSISTKPLPSSISTKPLSSPQPLSTP
ncbi:hypothetical protein ACKKBF_B21625 [Auxenochlorella protothecoides x Auxenochlorella symbiontica]